MGICFNLCAHITKNRILSQQSFCLSLIDIHVAPIEHSKHTSRYKYSEQGGHPKYQHPTQQIIHNPSLVLKTDEWITNTNNVRQFQFMPHL